LKTWINGALFIIGGLIGAGVLWLIASPPRGEPITLLTPPSPAPIVVHVEGQVANPGVQHLAPDSRVENAIEAAGGLLPEADISGLNLAAPLTDGSKLIIPRIPPTSFPTKNNQPGNNNPEVLTPEPSLTKSLSENVNVEEIVNINTATLQELDTLPGVGPSRAQAIIQYREQNGPYMRVEDVLNVPGIGPATYEKIKDLVKVNE